MPPDTPPAQTPQRRDLQAWRDALLQVRLPLLSSDEELDRLLSPGIGLGEVQTLAEADLPLALELLATAARDPRLEDGVRHLQQAVHVLGTERTQTLLRARQSRPTPRHATAHPLALHSFHRGEPAPGQRARRLRPTAVAPQSGPHSRTAGEAPA